MQGRELRLGAPAAVHNLRPGAGTPPLVALARNPWSKAQVARELGVSERTVTRYMAEGLPHVKPFGARGIVRFHPLQVTLWWAQRGRR